jgi:hypothetical protein
MSGDQDRCVRFRGGGWVSDGQSRDGSSVLSSKRRPREHGHEKQNISYPSRTATVLTMLPKKIHQTHPFNPCHHPRGVNLADDDPISHGRAQVLAVSGALDGSAGVYWAEGRWGRAVAGSCRVFVGRMSVRRVEWEVVVVARWIVFVSERVWSANSAKNPAVEGLNKVQKNVRCFHLSS